MLYLFGLKGVVQALFPWKSPFVLLQTLRVISACHHRRAEVADDTDSHCSAHPLIKVCSQRLSDWEDGGARCLHITIITPYIHVYPSLPVCVLSPLIRSHT